jgi:hypothetical protein
VVGRDGLQLKVVALDHAENGESATIKEKS